MNKGLIIGAASAAVVVLSCAAGGAVLASKIGNENTNNIQANAKTKLEEGKLEIKEGWKQENDSWYLYKNNEKQTDWIKDNNAWYYLGTDGKMRTGWIKAKDQWYYLNGDGTMATNTTVDGCYLNNSGLIEETPTKAKQTIKSSESNDDENNNITYKTYTNKRFLYSIDYPSNLIQGSGGEDGSGMDFKSADGMVTLGVSGMNNATFKTAEQYYNEMLNYLKVQPSYKHLESNSYTLSWEENGMISYRYFVEGNIHNGSFNDFTFKYPASERNYYDQVVVKIRNSFKTPDLDSSH